MKFLKGFVFICFSLSFNGFSQYDTLQRVADLNQDGYLDTLIKYYEGGSGFGGNTVEIVSGVDGASFEMNTYSCFCQIRNTFFIPDELLKPSNRGFLTTIENELFPPERAEPDPSLNWILTAALNSVKPNSDTLFSKIISPEATWLKGDITLPTNYSLFTKTDLMDGDYDEQYASNINRGTLEGIIVYWANTHYGFMQDSLTKIAQNKVYTIYKTKHGLIAQKADTYKWIFVSDYYTTGAPEKLRWASIEKVRLMGNYLFLEQGKAPYTVKQIFIININSGRLAKFSMFASSTYDLLDKKNHSILFEDEKTEYRFDEIITALENWKTD